MLKSIREFYELTKLDRAAIRVREEVPITYIKVFHKLYPRFPKISLPPLTAAETQAGGQIDQLYQLRLSEREYTGAPLSFNALARVLQSCRLVDPSRAPERRSYPSAGARFPVEIYIVVFNVDGLKPGCYHYAIAQNQLEQLWLKDLSDRAAEFTSVWTHHPSAAIIFTAVMARSEVKYGVKAYPMSLIESGHMAQNMVLACARNTVACCPILGFVNDSVSRALDLTDDEIPIYTLALGNALAPLERSDRDGGDSVTG